uniref:Flocculation protein FLO11-like n=1 Tax=Panagrellus redivivus TaxID=6233 RepID=A0A7E4ZRL4_PANRE
MQVPQYAPLSDPNKNNSRLKAIKSSPCRAEAETTSATSAVAQFMPVVNVIPWFRDTPSKESNNRKLKTIPLKLVPNAKLMLPAPFSFPVIYRKASAFNHQAAMTTTATTPGGTQPHTGSRSPFLNVFRKKPRPEAPSPDSGIVSDNQAPTPPKLTFTQRVHMHKNLRDGKIPDNYQSRHHFVAPSTSMSGFPGFKSKEKSSKLTKNKAFSADAISQLDPANLIEALEVIGDDQPIVARSIPKHAKLESDPNKEERRLRQNCIYEPEVYDKMLSDSLQMCDLLQTHLTDCITSTRAKSPPPTSPFRSPQRKNPNPPDDDDMRYTTIKPVPLASPIILSSITKKAPPPVPPKPTSVKPVNKNILSFAV